MSFHFFRLGGIIAVGEAYISVILGVEAVGRKFVEKAGKPLEMLEKIETKRVWKKREFIHAFPQEKGRKLFSTGDVYRILLILWKTSWKMLK